MSVDAVGAWVGQVLTRAESLFAIPADAAGTTSAGAVDDAVDRSRSITVVSRDFSGAAANAHRKAVGAPTERLQDAADADDTLHSQLARAARDHHHGHSDATALRAAAAQIPAAVGAVGSLPAGEVVVLSALRNRVAAMQDLVMRHSEEASRVAAALRNLRYR